MNAHNLVLCEFRGKISMDAYIKPISLQLGIVWSIVNKKTSLGLFSAEMS